MAALDRGSTAIIRVRGQGLDLGSQPSIRGMHGRSVRDGVLLKPEKNS